MKASAFICFAALCLLPGVVLAQSDTSAAKPGKLQTFENDLTTPQPDDSVEYHPHERDHRRHHDHCDDDDSSGFFSQLFGAILDIGVDAYAGLPNPNYGPYPYSNSGTFTADGPGDKVYVTAGAGYQQTYSGISTVSAQASFSAAAFIMDASFQSYREQDRYLRLSAIRLGVRKAAGSAVLWRNHFGWRHVEGGSIFNGVLFGTGCKIFTGGNMALDLGYDLNLFPTYGTVFHDVTGSASYFLGRAELTAGYHALITYKGSSLHGPFFGVNCHF